MKSLKKFGFAVIVAAVLFGVASCKNNSETETPHEHTFATDWASDATHHWHAATCGHTDEMSGKAEHTWDDGKVTKEATVEAEGEKTYSCTVCKETRTASIAKLEPDDTEKEPTTLEKEPEHSHTFATDWTHDATHHWHAATCEHTTEVSGKSEHIWVDEKCNICQRYSLENDKVINNKTFEKTGEVIVITTETTVKMTDDSAWSEYIDLTTDYKDLRKGSFAKGKNVKLSPFVMGKYEVTQELFEAVMGVNPSDFNSDPASGETQNLHPVDKVTWYVAIAFCNKLSILEGLDPCYTVEGVDFGTITFEDIPKFTYDKTWDAAQCDFTKKGYRLPREAEWEYAARGGDHNKVEWKYAFPGVNIAGSKITESTKTDTNLNDYAWNKSNSDGKTHEVGKKKPNTLGLYDMSGNVYEWCWDQFDPRLRSRRGGSVDAEIYRCTVSYREAFYPAVFVEDQKEYPPKCIGIRLVRSL